jgi:hypothetical protein
LAGRLELPLETSLVPINFDTTSMAIYEAPLEVGVVPVKFTGGMANLLDLEVFSPDQAELAIVPEESLDGPTVWVELQERMADKRPCIESQDLVTLHVETPAICHFLSGDTNDTTEEEPGDQIGLTVVAAGTCTLSAVRKSGGTAITQSFEVTL